MKRPAAAVAKKPSGNRPEPVFDKPLQWGCGRIYYSESKGAWRVYRRTSDKIEKTIKVEADDPDSVKEAWAKVLQAIENDPRDID